jgi:SAM-dependent methyltransferase
VEQDERLRFSFGAAAAAYAEHRPDYARAAVRWALERAPGPRVLDLGAGTGKLTAVMAALGADVIAVEPDPAMLAELRRALPDVLALPGRAEAIPLPDASVDAVLAPKVPSRQLPADSAAPPAPKDLGRSGFRGGFRGL